MRFWGCVPTAAELESPKLPPRIDRDVILRSPPPPPRLSKEEKLARGVLLKGDHQHHGKSRSKSSHARSKSSGARKTRSKHHASRAARRISSSSSSGNTSPVNHHSSHSLHSISHSRSGSLAHISTGGGSSRPPSRGGATPRSSPGTSSGFSSGGFSGSGSVIGTGPRQQNQPPPSVHFRSPSDQTPTSRRDGRPGHHQNYSFDGSDPVGGNSRSSQGKHTNRSKSASRSASSYNLHTSSAASAENRNFARSTQNFVVTTENTYALEIGPSASGHMVQRRFSRQQRNGDNVVTTTSVAASGGHSLFNMSSEPSLILHPGTSKTRDRKSKKSKKKGKRNA